MYIAISILIMLTCILLVVVVLVQNSKGGGIASGIIGSNPVMGVKKTTDFIEKLTWGLALTLVVLCLVAGIALMGTDDKGIGTSMQEQIDNQATPSNRPGTPAPQQQNQPAQPTPQEQPQQ